MPEASSPVICTLCEGDYFLGLGALLNSLKAAGFPGLFIIGYRGPLPGWLQSSGVNAIPAQMLLGNSMAIRLVQLEGPMHFTHRKAAFLRASLQSCNSAPTSLFYFDPDVVLKCQWDFLANWVQCGIAACEDVSSPMHHSDPRRRKWRDVCEENGKKWRNELDIYLNAGFVGISDRHFHFLDEWQEMLDLVFERIPHSANIKHGAPTDSFCTPDQDAFNMALCCTAAPLSFMGREAMDFRPGGHVMSHAIGPNKPWRTNFLLRALYGYPPRQVDSLFLKHAKGPIPVYSPFLQRMKLVNLSAARLLSRFYRRPRT